MVFAMIYFTPNIQSKKLFQLFIQPKKLFQLFIHSPWKMCCANASLHPTLDGWDMDFVMITSGNSYFCRSEENALKVQFLRWFILQVTPNIQPKKSFQLFIHFATKNVLHKGVIVMIQNLTLDGWDKDFVMTMDSHLYYLGTICAAIYIPAWN